ncbi:MAG: glutamate formiminotransferase / 5-formyltetrahydrofolate cyclo-ligase [Candidatus Atribacteria bacterium]|nr:glutamate formiminotransferase / 5-formyltetrahydrofolate cyclo-ligase [Candidatus Atribacteria bacterium]
MKEVIQSAINLSTSSPQVIEQVIGKISTVPALILADFSSDPDHNRSVITLLGESVSLQEAVMRIFEVVQTNLDISRHQGEHPRMGAVDVVPFTPWAGADMEACKKLAWQVGEQIASRFQVPVYFYGEAALLESHRDLSRVRRGGYERLQKEIQSIPDRKPDKGPAQLHPTLGAVAVGARGPLVAFNVNLRTDDIDLGRRIASRLRGENGGLKWVKAIGVHLKSRGMVQISMNLLDYRKSSLTQAFELVKLEAERCGVEVKESEVVGLLPLDALVEIASYALRIPNLSPHQVVEYHLAKIK